MRPRTSYADMTRLFNCVSIPRKSFNVLRKFGHSASFNRVYKTETQFCELITDETLLRHGTRHSTMNEWSSLVEILLQQWIRLSNYYVGLPNLHWKWWQTKWVLQLITQQSSINTQPPVTAVCVNYVNNTIKIISLCKEWDDLKTIQP